MDLFEASRAGNVEAVSALLSQGAHAVNDTTGNDVTALHLAAEHDHIDLARFLVGHGADIEARTAWTNNPFEWAATMGSPRVASFLLERGSSGLTLWTAAALGMVDILREGFQYPEAFVQPRAVYNNAVDWGWSPDSAFVLGNAVDDAFYAAARNGHVDAATLLQREGADINARGYFGGTGLHWAAHLGHLPMVQWLVEHNANRTLRDHRYDADAADWAREGGFDDIAVYLNQS